MFNLIEYKIYTSIFYISILVLISIFIYNLAHKKQGTYTNHIPLILDLIQKPVDNSNNILHKTKNIMDYHKDGYNNNYEDKMFMNKKLLNKPLNKNISKGELVCKKSIEKITGKKFIKTRPDFLQNKITGFNLELDCYNDELKLAIEYNGRQHYIYTPFFHKTKDSFYNLKYRDYIKKKLCKKNNIKLIIVPYTIPDNKIEKYIMKKL